MNRANISPFMRGFCGPALYDPDVSQDEGGSQAHLCAVFERLASTPEDVEKRDRIQAAHLAAVAANYGGAYDGKPYAQIGDAAIIPISGVLLNRFGGSWGYVTGYNAIRSQLNAALGDASVQRIVLDVDSPGGMVAGCFELAADIRAARDEKPVLAIVDGLCCSAAYALASQATSIYAAPSSMIGSIGVIAMHVSMAKMLENAGIEVTIIRAGEMKAAGNPYEKLSPAAKKDIQDRVDASYVVFQDAVAAGRGGKFTAEAARKTEARVYTASDAVALGMADRVSNPQAALSAFVRGDDPDDNREKASEDMTDKPQAVDQAAITASVKARIQGITTHAEATGREKLAAHLAFNTDLSVEDAAAVLAASPKAEAPKPEPKVETDSLTDRMAKTEQPNIKPGDADKTDDGDKASDRVGRLLGAYTAATGVKPLAH